MSVNRGDRVGAILSADEKTVFFLGYGIYEGEEIPPDALFQGAGMKNPKIRLDNGQVVWGYQCWWAPEDQVKRMIGNRTIKIVNLDGEAVAEGNHAGR